LWLIFCVGLDLVVLVTPAPVREVFIARPAVVLMLGTLAVSILAITFVPWFVVWFWGGRRMSDEELKIRTDELLRRSGVKARAILEWGRPGTGWANAGVLGAWAPFRYILISPGLMRLLTMDECEAVIAHEIGHVRHGHLGLYVFFTLGMMGFGNLMVRGMEAVGYKGPVEQGVVLLVLFVFYLWLLFRVVSRRCERQADLAAAEMMGTPVPLIAALEKLAYHSGEVREVASWHHDSVARRVERLMTEGTDPAAMQRYHRRLRRVRWGLLTASAVAIGLVLGMALTDPDKPSKKEAEERKPAVVLNTTRCNDQGDDHTVTILRQSLLPVHRGGGRGEG
jgi:Zn-dependent protease with chaperone function